MQAIIVFLLNFYPQRRRQIVHRTTSLALRNVISLATAHAHLEPSWGRTEKRVLVSVLPLFTSTHLKVCTNCRRPFARAKAQEPPTFLFSKTIVHSTSPCLACWVFPLVVKKVELAAQLSRKISFLEAKRISKPTRAREIKPETFGKGGKCYMRGVTCDWLRRYLRSDWLELVAQLTVQPIKAQ